jgi:hypothetical protein
MRRSQILSTSFEDAWIEVRFATTDAFMNRFHQLSDDKLLTPFKASGNINSIDKLSQEYYTAAWNATVGTAMPCSPLGILSSMAFPITLHPPLSVIRFRLSVPVMRYLSDNLVPTWNSFVIDKPTDVTLDTGPSICTWAGGESQIMCTASNGDSVLHKFIKDGRKAQELFPPKITLLTELIGGPQVIREYTFVPGLEPLTSGVPFRWNLSRYDEVKGSFYGGDPPPPGSSQPRGERKPPAGRGSVAQR